MSNTDQSVINYNNVNNIQQSNGTPNKIDGPLEVVSTTTTTEVIEQVTTNQTNNYDEKNAYDDYDPNDQNYEDEYYEDVGEYGDDYDAYYDETKRNVRPMTPERKKKIQRLTVKKMVECGGDLDYFDYLNQKSQSKTNHNTTKKSTKRKPRKHRNPSKKRKRSKSPNNKEKSISKSPNRRNRSKSPKKGGQISGLYGPRSPSPKNKSRNIQRSQSPKSQKNIPHYQRSLSPKGQKLLNQIHHSYPPKSRTMTNRSKSPKKRTKSPKKHRKHGKSRRKSPRKHGRSKSNRKPRKNGTNKYMNDTAPQPITTTKTIRTTTVTTYKRHDMTPKKSTINSSDKKNIKEPQKKKMVMSQPGQDNRHKYLDQLGSLRNTVNPEDEVEVFIPKHNDDNIRRTQTKSPKRFAYGGPTLKDQRREKERNRREEERKNKEEADMMEQIRRNELERERKAEMDYQRSLDTSCSTYNQSVEKEVGDGYIKTTTITESKRVTQNENLTVRQVGISNEDIGDNVNVDVNAEGIEDYDEGVESSGVYGGYDGLNEPVADEGVVPEEVEYQFVYHSNYLLIKPAKSFGNVIRAKVTDNGSELLIANTVSKLFVADQYYEVEKPFQFGELNTDNPQVYDLFNNYLANKSHIESSFYGLESCKYECQTCHAAQLFYHSFSMITPDLIGQTEVNLVDPIRYYFNYCPSLELNELCQCGDDNYTCEYFINPFPEFLMVYIKDSDVEVEVPSELILFDQYKYDRIHYNGFKDDKGWEVTDIREDNDIIISNKGLCFILYKRDGEYVGEDTDNVYESYDEGNLTINH